MQVRPPDGVPGAGQAQGLLERLRGLPAAARAPEHVGQLGLQVHRGIGHRLSRRALLGRDRQGGAERGDRFVVGEGRRGVVAGHLEVPQGARLLPGRGEVRAEHGGDLFLAAPRRGLQRPGGPAVQQAALRAQQAVVGRLLDEGVAEAVDGLGLPGHLLQQVLGAQLRQGGPQRLLRGAHRGQQREPELGPEHGRGADGVARRRAEPVHPGSSGPAPLPAAGPSCGPAAETGRRRAPWPAPAAGPAGPPPRAGRASLPPSWPAAAGRGRRAWTRRRRRSAPPATRSRWPRACGTHGPGGSCRARARRSRARPSRARAPPRAGPCRAPPARPAAPPAGRARPARAGGLRPAASVRPGRSRSAGPGPPPPARWRPS